jgi:hypothetical protein
MANLTINNHVRRSDRVIAQSTAGTTVLLSMDGGKYYSLDEVGSRVWELSDGTRSIGETVAVLGGEYEVPRETLERDVLELLTDLRNENLVESLP